MRPQERVPEESKNIKDFLLNYKPNNLTSLICFDDCKQCVILKDGVEVYNQPNKFTTLSSEALIFKDGELVKLEFPKLYYEKKFYPVCLQFDLFPNGGNSSFVIKDNEQFSFYETYFDTLKVFQNEEDVLDFYESKTSLIPANIDDFAKE